MNLSIAFSCNLADFLFNRSYLTRQWKGYRPKLEDMGIIFNLDYTSDLFSNVSGGLNSKSVYLDNIDITLSLEMEKLTGWKGTDLYFYILGNHGKSPGELTGDIQALSNIDAYNTWKLYEAWIQNKFLNDRTSILTGLYDLNSEFDVIETAGLFINSSHGIGPDFSQSGKNGPSIFPTTSVGLRIKFVLNEKYYFQFAVLDGVPGDPENPNGTHIIFRKGDGLLLASEWKYCLQSSESSEVNSTKIAIGGWYYTGMFNHIFRENIQGKPVNQTGNYGMYILGETKIFSETSSLNQGVSIFSRFGFADPKVNQFHYYFGGGFVYNGLIPGRNEDKLGLAIATVINGENFKKMNYQSGNTVDDFETAVEFTYLFLLSPCLSLQPDIQYIINPSMDKKINNALAIGCRFILLF